MASAELLKQIRAGKGLKKVQTNGRSTPVIEGKKGGGGGGGPPIGIRGGGPPQLSGLFAGSMPKLKPAGSSSRKLKISPQIKSRSLIRESWTAKPPPQLGKPPTIPGHNVPMQMLPAPKPLTWQPPAPTPSKQSPQPPVRPLVQPPNRPAVQPPCLPVQPPSRPLPLLQPPPPTLPMRTLPHLPNRDVPIPLQYSTLEHQPTESPSKPGLPSCTIPPPRPSTNPPPPGRPPPPLRTATPSQTMTPQSDGELPVPSLSIPLRPVPPIQTRNTGAPTCYDDFTHKFFQPYPANVIVRSKSESLQSNNLDPSLSSHYLTDPLTHNLYMQLIPMLELYLKAMISRSPACLCETLGGSSVSGCQYHYGGVRPNKNIWDISEIQPYITGVLNPHWLQYKHVRYHSHCCVTHARSHPDMLHATIPLHILTQKLIRADIRDLCDVHNLSVTKSINLEILKERLANVECHNHVTIFVPLEKPTILLLSQSHHESFALQEEQVHFPPQPLAPDIKNQIIEDFCKELSPEKIVENGCAVCGSLTLQQSLSPVTDFDIDFFSLCISQDKV